MRALKHLIKPRSPRISSTLLLLFFTFLSVVTANAQTGAVTVSGKVNLGSGTELSGTSVQIKGTGKGVSTNALGHFAISAPLGATLVISHIGYRSKEVKVSGQDELNITLEASDNSLDQVVVVSYGKQRQRDITGSVAKVDANAVQDITASEVGQKLQGKVAGLQLNQTSGILGGAMTFRIRGAASLSASNQPLIVIDGQAIVSDLSGTLNLINPDEIESYSVLKDAAATALYGSRASNGVVIITTKSAKLGRTSVTANAYYGLQSVPQRGRPKLMNANQFATFMNGYYQDKITYENWINPVTGTHSIPGDYANPSQYGKGTDWYSAIIHTAPIDNYSVNLSSATEKVSSSTTLSYYNQSGVLYNTNLQRFSFRSNNEYRPISRIKIGVNLAPTYQINHNINGGNLAINGNRQVVSGAEISSPLIAPYKTDGTYSLSTTSYGMYALPNFLQQEKIMNNNQTNFHFLGNAYLDIEVLKGLHVKSTINGDLGSQEYNAYYGTQYGIFGAPPPRPTTSSSATSNSYNSYTWLNENTIDYSNTFGDHTLDVLAGYTTQKYNQDTRTINGTGFANDAIPWISGATTTSGTTNNTQWSLASELARVNYDYKKKYYLSGSIRRDGSSRFGSLKKYGTFPSVSAGWVVSDESFFPKSNAFNFLKLRGSYGLTGNFNIGNYVQVSNVTGSNYVLSGATTPGEAITVLGNPDLTWETSKQTDLGLEANFLNNRITFSYDYYNTKTTGMLSSIQLPYASGFGSLAYNVASLHLWGNEFTISSKNLVGKLTWSTDFNIAFNSNKVTSLVNNTPIGGTGMYSDYNRTAVGHPIGELYGMVFAGIYMTQADFDKYPHYSTSAVGSTRMLDLNGDGVIDLKDRTFLGNPTPKFIYGITNSFSYKNFDLAILASGQVGNKIMNTNLQNLQNLDGIFNIDADMQDRWRSLSNPGNGKVPRTLSGTTELYRLVNSNWVFSGDYLAIKNISLGYTIRQQSLRYIRSIRVYASVQNALMFTKYPGQNPEVNDTKDSQTTAGQDNGSYPVPRVMMVGANINF